MRAPSARSPYTESFADNRGRSAYPTSRPSARTNLTLGHQRQRDARGRPRNGHGDGDRRGCHQRSCYGRQPDCGAEQQRDSHPHALESRGARTRGVPAIRVVADRSSLRNGNGCRKDAGELSRFPDAHPGRRRDDSLVHPARSPGLRIRLYVRWRTTRSLKSNMNDTTDASSHDRRIGRRTVLSWAHRDPRRTRWLFFIAIRDKEPELRDIATAWK